MRPIDPDTERFCAVAFFSWKELLKLNSHPFAGWFHAFAAGLLQVLVDLQ
jgi:hypothetical protein